MSSRVVSQVLNGNESALYIKEGILWHKYSKNEAMYGSADENLIGHLQASKPVDP